MCARCALSACCCTTHSHEPPRNFPIDKKVNEKKNAGKYEKNALQTLDNASPKRFIHSFSTVIICLLFVCSLHLSRGLSSFSNPHNVLRRIYLYLYEALALIIISLILLISYLTIFQSFLIHTTTFCWLLARLAAVVSNFKA